ncbi:MAG TPA: hypothetical protein PL124_03060 [Candidatus Cloacimonadota bacterium]|nr:hypothetical protein [Candidatus Cloacimonadota bacterium]HPS38372.1 hypothetical protein [Candidatus Cloacimonadota bacterium]
MNDNILVIATEKTRTVIAENLSQDQLNRIAAIASEPKEPKPLLADAKVGDLCKHRNGDWSQIIDTNGTYIQGQPIRTTLKDTNGINRNFCLSGSHFTMQFDGEYDIIHTEPLAPEGTAEWAWQMAKLGIETKCIYGKIRISDSGMIEVCYNGMAYAMPLTQSAENRKYVINKIRECSPDSWQIYNEPNPEPEPCDPEYSDSELLMELLRDKRLCKVLMSGKYYLVTTHTEPYFRDFYATIRDNERKQGTWSDADERIYQRALTELGIVEPNPQFLAGDLVTDGVVQGRIVTRTADTTWVEDWDGIQYNIETSRLRKLSPSEVKVGDWVEHEKSKEQGRITYISSDNYDAIEVKLYGQDDLETYTKSDFNADFRKLSPSEVRVSLTLSGTVEKVEDTGCFLLNVGNEGIAYCLDYEALTHADAELVRELTGGGE